jgi:hypothetical protein
LMLTRTTEPYLQYSTGPPRPGEPTILPLQGHGGNAQNELQPGLYTSTDSAPVDDAVTKLEDALVKQTRDKMFDFVVITAQDTDKADETNLDVIKMPGRRSYGKAGKHTKMRTNYLKLSTAHDGDKSLSPKNIYKYHVAFTPGLQGTKRRRMMRHILEQPLFRNKAFASDFATTIITTEQLDLETAVQSKLLEDDPVEIPRDPLDTTSAAQQQRTAAQRNTSRNQVRYRVEYEEQISLKHITD